MKVFVYFNLHSKLWSVKALEGPYAGKVIGHGPSVCLHQVTPSVSATGRDRVRREGRKNVHAGLVGNLIMTHKFTTFKGRHITTWDEEPNPDYSKLSEITYNPYKYDSFIYKANGFKYDCSNLALLHDRRVYVIG